MKTSKDYIGMPANVMQAAHELQRAIDDYWAGRLPELELKEYVWRLYTGGYLRRLAGSDQAWNRTIEKLCGKRRMTVVKRLVDSE